jgi:4-amino-4-deoxy-L-arabinose transferase-like glycosyltransferase
MRLNVSGMQDEGGMPPPQGARSTSVWAALALLLALLALGLWLRSGFPSQNLPLCLNTDERINRTVLERFETEGLNPHFFNYPTLYFYATHFFYKLGGFEDVLYAGRLLNLVLSAALALAVFWLGRRIGVSPWGAAFAGALSFFSPLMMASGEYVTTDIMMPLMAVMGLTFLLGYFQQGGLRSWLAAMVFLGLAISTKYTAMLLLFAYVGFEWVAPRPMAKVEGRAGRIAAFLNASRPMWLVVLCFAAASVALGFWVFFPTDFLASVIQSTRGVNSSMDPSDWIFLEGIRKKFLLLAVVATVAGAIFLRFRRLAERLSVTRVYAGIGLAGLAFLAGTPFLLVSFKNFLYDFGYELKANAMFSEQTYWLHYWRWAVSWHGYAWLAASAVGFGVWLKRSRAAWMVALFFLLFYLAIGSATRGFERYLTGVLPIAFALAALGGEWVYHRLQLRLRGLGAAVLIGGISIMAWEWMPRIQYYLEGVPRMNEFRGSYEKVRSLAPTHVLYAGFAPHFELSKTGIKVEEVSDAELQDESYWQKFWQNPEQNPERAKALLLINGSKKPLLSPALSSRLELIYSDETRNSQWLYRFRSAHVDDGEE